MKKLVLSAALIAVFTGGMSGVVNMAAPGVASACGWEQSRSDALAASLPQVNKGDRGQYVLALQLALRDEGYTYLRGSGFYADLTARAVKDFQRKHGIKASGIVGSKTWHALVGPKPRSVTTHAGGKPTFGIQPGERNSHKVLVLADMLMRVHPYARTEFDDMVYDATLQRLVRDFQQRAGIKASGIVGPRTWAALDKVVSVSGHWGC
jgi:peptidoglycan hydrolase-like protein with peptidoglycan-binding domain